MKQKSTVEAKVSYWQDLVAAQEAGGLSARQFCAHQGLVLSQFYYWRRRLQAGSSSFWGPLRKRNIKPVKGAMLQEPIDKAGKGTPRCSATSLRGVPFSRSFPSRCHLALRH